jgi:hypothetical protein
LRHDGEQFDPRGVLGVQGRDRTEAEEKSKNVAHEKVGVMEVGCRLEQYA